jgi:hypothetical protein
VFRDGDLCVRVVGVPYRSELKIKELLSIKKNKKDEYLVAVVHALASTEAVENFWNETMFSYDSLITSDGPDVWCFGHLHRDQGVKLISNKYFVNQGAISRGSLVDENIERNPKVAILEFSQGDIRIELRSLVVAPASEVFDLEKKAIQERERRDIDQFVMHLISDGILDPNSNIEDNINKLGFADDVRKEALKYLELTE